MTDELAVCLLRNGRKPVSVSRYPIPLVAGSRRVHSVSAMRILLFAALVLPAMAAGQNPAPRWSELNTEGIRLVRIGDYAGAESKFRAALLEAQNIFEERDFRLSANLSNLALVRQEQGDFNEAEKIYRRVLQLREKYLPANSVETASTLNNLGSVLHSAARDQEADPLLRRAILIAEEARDDRVLAASLNTLGLTLSGQGEAARAEPVLRRALALFDKIGGPESIDVGKTLNNLAALYSSENDFANAENCARRALPIYEKNLPPGHPLIGAALNNLFVILGSQKRYGEGEPYLRRALQISERAAPDGLRTQQMRGNLAALEESRGNWQTAADLLQKVIAAEERALGPNHPSLAVTLGNYSEALKHLNHKQEAKEAERRANAIAKSFRPPSEPRP